MYYISDLLELCEKEENISKNIYLIISGEEEKYKIPMSKNYYVADDMFFFEVVFRNEKTLKGEDFIELIESECENDLDCWGGNLYVAPMEKVGNCELKFAKNMIEVVDKDIFYNCYEIEKIESKIVNIENGSKEILIYLK